MMQKKKKEIAKEMTITGYVEEFDSIEDGVGILIAGDDDENTMSWNPTKTARSFLHISTKGSRLPGWFPRIGTASSISA